MRRRRLQTRSLRQGGCRKCGPRAVAPPMAAERASALRSPTMTSRDRSCRGRHSNASRTRPTARGHGSNLGGAIAAEGKDRRWRRRARRFAALGSRAQALCAFSRGPSATCSMGFATDGWLIADKVTAAAPVGGRREDATTAPQTSVSANASAWSGQAASTALERSPNREGCSFAEFGRIPKSRSQSPISGSAPVMAIAFEEIHSPVAMPKRQSKWLAGRRQAPRRGESIVAFSELSARM